MSRTSILAVTAVTAIILAIPATLSTTMPSMASFSPHWTVGDGEGEGDEGGEGSSAPASQAQPTDPKGGGGNGGDLPAPSPAEKIAQLEQTCNAALSTLVKIPAAMVQSFDGGVNVVPVCNSGEGHKAQIDNSQAAPLEAAIGDNSALSGQLGKAGFKPADVVGIVLINGQATLYVHTPS